MNKEILENIKINSIYPYERNARKNDIAVKEVIKSIERTGYRTPIIIDENNIILAGHTRFKALQKMGYKEIPFVVKYNDLTEKQKQEYRIRDNKSGEFAEWDFEILEADFSIEELTDFGFNINEIKENEKEESTICKSDREKREEIEVDENEKDIEIHKWIDSFENILCMFSGGKDSMALVADLLDYGIDKNKITLVFNLTPLDYPDLKNFVIEFAKNNNLKLEIIGDEKTEKQKSEMFQKNGFPLPYMSWCTGTWKVQPLNKFIKEKCIDKDKYILCQGWRREESEFRATAKDKVIHGVHKIKMARPILDYTENQVFEIIKKHKWILHRAYNYYKRLGCIYCFSKTREEWDLMRQNDPETFLLALNYVADGMCSKNVSTEYGFNAIRKMMGKPTISEVKKNVKE